MLQSVCVCVFALSVCRSNDIVGFSHNISISDSSPEMFFRAIKHQKIRFFKKEKTKALWRVQTARSPKATKGNVWKRLHL